MPIPETIRVDYLARVEGEGALTVKMRGKEVETAEFRIFEPPRFFEALLRGREHTEVPDITSRICGICPIAYQMSATHAIEQALGLQLTPTIRELRRLIFCGEWIESHGLHVTMLHAPDFLGYDDAIQMAQKYPKQVTAGLKLKKAGNDLMTAIGGREIHPINVRIGGFYRFPEPAALRKLLEPMKHARDLAFDTVRFVSTLDFPDYVHDYEFVALSHPDEYPINEGRIVSSRGLNITAAEYLEHFEEIHIEHTHALHSVIKGRGEYLTGPQARYYLNEEKLPETVKQAARLANFKRKDCLNPFKSIIVRSLEMLYACEEAIRILNAYEAEGLSWIPYAPHAGVGHGCTEAPRGILYHRYELDPAGLIREAKIVPPTSQNQKAIETDLLNVARKFIHLPKDQLQRRCEQAVRNYDPCISCATHFLKLEIENVA
ncbi:MAG: dehydrogenase [Bdellovibrionales bacterium GWB1_52_6]|nr:MAG: dehydrogenase [Bdellovibrionales bacterium GWB1_52_6]OFZ04191.1 MAG: dehydrogenase [Bdellovibrionales bacterium GWA1_52_35]HCM40489.1 Ni/Fe hydrogenase subunit alpha [Bdellovibrionales bacterium]